MFGINSATISSTNQAAISAFVSGRAADSLPVQIDGYASKDGPQELNWNLSCQRAASIKTALVAAGIPDVQIQTTAHGETSEFAGGTTANRRAIISTNASIPNSTQIPAAPPHATPVTPIEDESRDRQTACVVRLGGCTNTRAAGLPTLEEMERYNQSCRTESEYIGPDVTPNTDECINPPRPPVVHDRTPINVTAIDEIDSVGTIESVFSIGEVNFTDLTSMVDNILARIGQRPMSRLDIQVHGSPQAAFIGNTHITVGSFAAYASTLGRLRGHFTSSGFVHLRACLVGQNLPLLRLFSDAFGVHVYAGTGNQHNVLIPFNEGDYVCCHPGGMCDTNVSRP
jgi:hypothetical protein